MSKVPHTHGQVVVICLFKTYKKQESGATCKSAGKRRPL